MRATNYKTRADEIVGVIRLLSLYTNLQVVGMLLTAGHLRKKATMDDEELFEQYCKIMEG